VREEYAQVLTKLDLGYQAAQRIVSAANPLKLMKDLSQSFPSHAVALSRVKVNDTFKSELQSNRLINEGDSLALINGRIIQLDTINLFQ
jgi:UDP-glucose:glycoprotein glucosyltransferase